MILGDLIAFGEGKPDLNYYETISWNLEEHHDVEFFPGAVFSVLLTSTEADQFETVLKSYEDNEAMALDLEWETELCLFQFCSSKGVLIVRHPPGEGNEVLRAFLRRNKFYAKGIHNDKIQLKAKFGEDFAENIEDIAATRLAPYNFSENFMAMTKQFAGEPSAIFKDVRITKSDWSLPELSARQILYAAFDVVALYQAYPNFPPPGVRIKRKGPSATPAKAVQRAHSTDILKRQIKPKKEKVRKQCFKKILLKPTQASRVFCYLFEGYTGPVSCLDLRDVCVNVKEEDIDYVGYYGGYLMVSLLKDVEITLKHEYAKVTKLPELDPLDCCDNDVFFLQNAPKVLEDENEMNLFLFAFGKDHRTTYEQWYVRVQIHRAQASLRLKTFLPYLLIDDGKAVQFQTFPWFLPMVRAIVPCDYTTDETKDLFSRFGTVVDVSHLRQRNPSIPNTAIVTFESVEQAEKALEINYEVVRGMTIYAQRFVDEQYIRVIRSRELLYRADSVNEIEMRKKCEKYGRVFAIYWDSLMHVEHIQYYEKPAVSEALANEPDMELIPTGTVTFIRNLPLDMTEQEALDIASRYGVVKTILFQDLDDFMRTAIAEIVFETEEQAASLKQSLHQTKFKKETLEVNAVNARSCEAPIWKMQQRKCWLVSNSFSDEREALKKCTSYGHVVDIVRNEEIIYVRFLTAEMCERAVSEISAYVPLPIDFATKIDADSFTIVDQAMKQRTYIGHQIMAIVIDPLPPSLTKEQIYKILEDTTNFEVIIVKSYQSDQPDARRAVVYGKSKRASMRGYGKLYNQRFEGELLPLFRYDLSELPKAPRYKPFEQFRKPRKMAIVADPVPSSMTDSSVREMMVDCGKYDIRFTKSAVVEGGRRLILQPRNLRAKVDCFRILNSSVVDGVQLSAVRMNPDEIPKGIGEHSEEEEIFY